MKQANLLAGSRAKLLRETLRRPTSPSTGEAGRSPAVLEPGDVSEPGEVQEPGEIAEPAEVPEPTEAPEPLKVEYTVQIGDTLSEIAERHGVSMRNIREWNNLRGSGVQLGQKLTLYVAEMPVLPGADGETGGDQAEPSTYISTKTHVVRPGESLGSIAARYNTSRRALMDLNNMGDPNKILVGQKLKVPE